MYQLVQGPKLGSECDPCLFGNLPNSEIFECGSHFRGNATKLAVSDGAAAVSNNGGADPFGETQWSWSGSPKVYAGSKSEFSVM